MTIDKLRQLIKSEDAAGIVQTFEENNVVSMAKIVENMTLEEIVFILSFLPKNISGDLFAAFDTDKKTEFISQLSSSEINNVLDKLYADDLFKLMGEFPSNVAKKIISSASDKTRKDINQLLNYEDKSAGAMMTVEFVELKASDTFNEALQKVRQQGHMAEIVTDCYIVDSRRVLKGSIKLKDLLFENKDAIVEDHMQTSLVTVTTHTDQEEVLTIMQKYDLHVLPVVNEDYCLVGLITVDDILDVMEDEVTEDIHKMAAIKPQEDSYLNTSVWEMTKSRAPWLMILMVSALFTELVLNYFEAPLEAVPILAAFIPMVMGTAGNAANQSSVMVIRGISVDGLGIKDSVKIFLKELSVSFYVGALLFVVSMLRLLILPPSIGLDVALSISISIVLSIVLANIIGGLLPVLALILKQDPAAMAAPLISNLMDIGSLVIYFTVSKLILGI